MNTRFDQSTERRQSYDGETGLDHHEITGSNRDGGWVLVVSTGLASRDPPTPADVFLTSTQ